MVVQVVWMEPISIMQGIFVVRGSDEDPIGRHVLHNLRHIAFMDLLSKPFGSELLIKANFITEFQNDALKILIRDIKVGFPVIFLLHVNHL